ncbi:MULTISPECIES: choice-of-anchor Q domain-containing protein [Brasilonema]|nr:MULTISPECIES: choice-of-anchor Q domain-containing protein [Brasilonema]
MSTQVGNDFHLASGSSAIGQYDQHDLDSVQRPQGAGTDMGAYEYGSHA